jgi:ribosome-binding protein aMBF1 (putative translation factor)
MPQIGTSGSMSGERKRSDGSQSEPQATAPLLDSTAPFSVSTVGLWRTATALITAVPEHASRAVRAARVQRALSQADLPEKLDLSLLAVSNIERGESIPLL